MVSTWEKNSLKAHCRPCDSDFSIKNGGESDVKRHAETDKHKTNSGKWNRQRHLISAPAGGSLSSNLEVDKVKKTVILSHQEQVTGGNHTGSTYCAAQPLIHVMR